MHMLANRRNTHHLSQEEIIQGTSWNGEGDLGLTGSYLR